MVCSLIYQMDSGHLHCTLLEGDEVSNVQVEPQPPLNLVPRISL